MYFKNQPNIPTSIFTNAIFRYGSPFWSPGKAVYLLAFTSCSVYCMKSLCCFVYLPQFPDPSWGPELLYRFFSSAPPWLSLLHPLMPWSCGALDRAAMKAARLWEWAAWERSEEASLCGFCPEPSELQLRAGFHPWSLLKLHFRCVCACLQLCQAPHGLAELTSLLEPRPALALWTCLGREDLADSGYYHWTGPVPLWVMCSCPALLLPSAVEQERNEAFEGSTEHGDF